MTTFFKKTAKDWGRLSLMEQLANIGAEVCRALRFKNKGDKNEAKVAFYRALELFDLTIADEKNRFRLKEILRMREIFADYFLGNNPYHFKDSDFDRYFLLFNLAIRKRF